MSNLDNLMEEVIVRQLETCKAPGLTTSDRTLVIENTVKLYEAKASMTKAELEYETKELEREVELKKAKQEMMMKIGLGIAQTMIPLVFYGLWTRRLMIFEETGHIPTSMMFRHLMNHIRPK